MARRERTYAKAPPKVLPRRIPYAMDKNWVACEPENAVPRAYYFCPECGERVTGKHPREKIDHFAHRPGDAPCELRDASATRYATQRQRAIDEYSDRHDLRPQLHRKPFGTGYDFIAMIPVLTTTDLAIIRKATARLSVRSFGIMNEPSEERLSPGGGPYYALLLDPEASTHRVAIGPPPVSIAGEYVARTLAPGSCFIGNEKSAVHVRTPRWLPSGSICYFILAEAEDGPPGSEVLAVGGYRLAKFPIGAATMDFLRARFPLAMLDSFPLGADVHLPMHAPPDASITGRITAPPGTSCLVSISPPGETDPVLECLPLPFRGNVIRIPPAGAGKPRFLRFRVPLEGSRRFLIVWPLFYGREIFLEVTPGPAPGLPNLDAFHFGLQTEHTRQRRTGRAVENATFEVETELVTDGSPRMRGVELLAPPGFKVKLTASYSELGDVPVDEGAVTAEGLSARLESCFENGANHVDVSFGILGKVRVVCPFLTNRWATARERERDALREQAGNQARAREQRRRRDEGIRSAAEARREDSSSSEGAPTEVEALFEARRAKAENARIQRRIQGLGHAEALRYGRRVSRKMAAEILNLPLDTDPHVLDKWRAPIKKRLHELRLQPRPENPDRPTEQSPPSSTATELPTRREPLARQKPTVQDRPARRARSAKQRAAPKPPRPAAKRNNNELLELARRLDGWKGDPSLRRDKDKQGKTLEPSEREYTAFIAQIMSIPPRTAGFLWRANRRRVEKLIRARERDLFSE